MKHSPIIYSAALVSMIFIPGPSSAEDDAGRAYIEAHKRMMAGMEMEHVGDPDKDFVMMMIPHHQGAIDMAKVQLQYGKDPVLRELAAKIIADQEREIAEMKQWQSERSSAQ